MSNLHAESISAESNSGVVNISGRPDILIRKILNEKFKCIKLYKKCIKYIEYKFVNKLNENAFWYHEKSDIMRIYFVECTNLFWLNKNIFWNPMTFIFGTFGLAVLLIDPNSMQNNISTLLPLLPLKNVYCCR